MIHRSKETISSYSDVQYDIEDTGGNRQFGAGSTGNRFINNKIVLLLFRIVGFTSRTPDLLLYANSRGPNIVSVFDCLPRNVSTQRRLNDLSTQATGVDEQACEQASDGQEETGDMY